MQHSRANQLVVFRQLRNLARQRHVDEASICDVVAVAEKLFWVPTQMEAFAGRLAATETYSEAYALRGDAYRVEQRWRVGRWLESVGLLGRKSIKEIKATG